MNILKSNGLLSNPAKQFILQDVETITKQLPMIAPKIANAATDVAALFSKWLGKGR